jgi:hypothetical protein
MTLRKRIHETLVENKSSLLVESRISEAQFLTLSSCNTKTELIENIIYRVNLLEDRNFNKKVINESLIKVLRTLFGDFDESFYTGLKTTYANWLSDKMDFSNEKEWIREAITNKIMETTNEDFEKLFTCRYLAELMTDAVMSDFENKVLSSGIDKKLGGPVGEKFKDLIVQATNDSGVQKDLEETMREKICPEIEKINAKMDAKKEQIKTMLSVPITEQ